MNPKVFVRSLALAALLVPALVAQSVQSRAISFDDFAPSWDGVAVRDIYAEATFTATIKTGVIIFTPTPSHDDPCGPTGLEACTWTEHVDLLQTFGFIWGARP